MLFSYCRRKKTIEIRKKYRKFSLCLFCLFYSCRKGLTEEGGGSYNLSETSLICWYKLSSIELGKCLIQALLVIKICLIWFAMFKFSLCLFCLFYSCRKGLTEEGGGSYNLSETSLICWYKLSSIELGKCLIQALLVIKICLIWFAMLIFFMDTHLWE